MKDKFNSNPALAAIRDDQTILKNFGLNKFADPDVDEDDLEEQEMGIFEGDANMDREMTKKRVVDMIYGS